MDKILFVLKGSRFRKVLVTNGTLVDEDKTLLMKKAGIIPAISVGDSEEMGL